MNRIQWTPGTVYKISKFVKHDSMVCTMVICVSARLVVNVLKHAKTLIQCGPLETTLVFGQNKAGNYGKFSTPK